MYWYTDTFSMKNVSMCRYRYILRVSDTDTVSNTKGLPLSHFEEKCWSTWSAKTFSHFKMVPSQPCRIALLLNPISSIFGKNLQLYQNDSRPKLGKILCGGGLDSFLVKPSIIWETSVGRVLVCIAQCFSAHVEVYHTRILLHNYYSLKSFY